MTDILELDIPERQPKYEIVKVVADLFNEETLDKQKLVQVKLGQPHIARIVGTTEYLETDYVLVGMAHLTKTDRTGTFTYEETSVTACDEEGKQPDQALLYLTTRMLDVEEALFAIGEI